MLDGFARNIPHGILLVRFRTHKRVGKSSCDAVNLTPPLLLFDRTTYGLHWPPKNGYLLHRELSTHVIVKPG